MAVHFDSDSSQEGERRGGGGLEKTGGPGEKGEADA